jgi:zinc D-Ala-D-Ala carboxypeptidase
MSEQLLSKNFTLRELIESQTATRLNINNTPNHTVVANLQNLAINVLQPLRDLVRQPIVISSGYRCEELNRAIGGAQSSEHMTGCAADLSVPDMSNRDVAVIIRDKLKFNQLILEFYKADNPFHGWVHVSYSVQGNRQEVMTFDGKNYARGLG